MSKVSKLIEQRTFLQQFSLTHPPRCGGLIDPESTEVSIATLLIDLSGVRYLHLGHMSFDISS